jgi:hypothetical protein
MLNRNSCQKSKQNMYFIQKFKYVSTMSDQKNKKIQNILKLNHINKQITQKQHESRESSYNQGIFILRIMYTHECL